jgi:hypothetical protein
MRMEWLSIYIGAIYKPRTAQQPISRPGRDINQT